jgi:rare lipoprotein A
MHRREITLHQNATLNYRMRIARPCSFGQPSSPGRPSMETEGMSKESAGMSARLWISLVMTWMLSVSYIASAETAHHHSRVASPDSRVPTQQKVAGSKVQIGEASVYARKLQGKKTATGERFDEHKPTAASKTLPLHSKAKVTNLKTGRSVDVTITDRGPYAKHRVVDLSSAAAKQIGIDKEKGVAPVEVKPTAEPVQASGETVTVAPDH